MTQCLSVSYRFWPIRSEAQESTSSLGNYFAQVGNSGLKDQAKIFDVILIKAVNRERIWEPLGRSRRIFFFFYHAQVPHGLTDYNSWGGNRECEQWTGVWNMAGRVFWKYFLVENYCFWGRISAKWGNIKVLVTKTELWGGRWRRSPGSSELVGHTHPLCCRMLQKQHINMAWVHTPCQALSFAKYSPQISLFNHQQPLT